MAGEKSPIRLFDSSPATLPATSLAKIATYGEKRLYQIYSPLVDLESTIFPDNTAVHKLSFLTKRNVATATDFEGNPIYAKPHDYPKMSELDEARAAISRYFEEQTGDIVPVLSEIADIYHNLFCLRKLDPAAKDLYRTAVRDLTLTLAGGKDDPADSPFAIQDSFALPLIKYRARYTLGIDHALENELIKQAISPRGEGKPLVSIPTDAGLAAAYDKIDELEAKVVATRLLQLKWQSECNQNGKSGQVVFKRTNSG